MITKIKRIVDKNNDRIAYVVNDKCISYGDLWKQACDKAQFLKKQGDLPVIIYGHKSLNMIISILSCIIAERTYIPIDLCTPVSRIRKIIEITKASLIITNESIKLDGIDCYTLDELKKFKNENIKVKRDNNYIYIIFTSGSTGEPKGVPISKENLNSFIDWISNLPPLCYYSNANVLNQASFSFDLSVADLFYSLCNGHTLVALDKEFQDDYNAIFDVFRDNKIDVAVMTPTFMKLCLLNCDFNEHNLNSLKCIYFCGEQLESKTVAKIFDSFPNIKVINAYGPTEATSAVSGVLITKKMLDDGKILPVGEINNSATDIIIDNEEIVLKGKSVFNGYLGNHIGGYFQENGNNCFRTGDIGYIIDNKLYCKGRKDYQVKYKGYRIELNDIEYNISQIKGVKDCAVAAKYNENSIVKTLKAYVVCEQGFDDKYVKKELQKLIPYYMVPKIIKLIDRLPINKNGKVDRKMLSEL